MKPTTVTPGQRIRQVLQTIVLAVAGLYFGREVLIPLAMAILLTFLLSPVVTWLERRKVGRIPAVILVMALIFSTLSIGGFFVAGELATLGSNLDDYKGNLKGRIKGLLPGKDNAFGKISNIAAEVQEELEKEAKEEGKAPIGEVTTDGEARNLQLGVEEPPVHEPAPHAVTTRSTDTAPPGANADLTEASSQDAEAETEPQPVRVVSETTAFDTLGAYTETFLTPLANLAIIVVLVIFMLIQREDLRNRLVRLAGKKLTLTTRTLDEVGTRISKYLLALSLVNGSFGLAMTIGLWAIGVPYPVLWGFLAATLRFVPYVGPVLAAGLAVAMSLVHFPADDWLHPGMTVGLILVLELVSNNLIEPLAYGRSTGVSVVAILVSATFWTWIWGPVGLMLSVPMTVVLAVLGEHVPALEPLGVLLGDKPALATHMTYYQRLLAQDFDEASSIVDEHAKANCLESTYDQVLIPALVLAERDHSTGDLTDEEQSYIWQSTRDLVDEMLPQEETKPDCVEEPSKRAKIFVLGCPAHDASDELSLKMLGQLMSNQPNEIEILPANLLASEVISKIAERVPDVVCVSSLGPVGSRQTRYLCKRIRANFPSLRLLVGRWGYRGDRDRLVSSLQLRGADQVVTNLADACDALNRITPLEATKTAATTAVKTSS